MSAAAVITSFGSDLTRDDLQRLAERWITPELASAAGLRRVDSLTGREMFARKTGDFAGIIIPNCWPGEPRPREYRLRRDSPDLEYGIDGSTKETHKYVQPSGRGNRVYVPPGTPPQLLTDVNVPVIITEGEFKCLALSRLASHNADRPRFLPIALAGVWCFRGVVGKTTGPNGDRRDIKGIISDVDRIDLKGRQTIIAFDADAEANPKVKAARWQLSSVVINRGATVGVLEWPIKEGKGIDDRLANVGPDRVLADIAAVQFGDWHAKLLRNDAGKLLACHENAALFLENSSEWNGVLGYNEFTAGFEIMKPPPPPVTAAAGTELEDDFDTDVVRWLERRGVMVRPDLARRIIDVVAKRNSFHPIVDYLESLEWDDTPRIGAWLVNYCGVELSDANPSRYAEVVGERFLISAVARVLKPGCKVDHTLVLEGAQGIGKSTAARILAGDEYFTDQLSDMGSKDCSMQIRGCWVVELSELEALNRVEMGRAKRFLSQQLERFRLPYGHRLVRVPRQCVFIGTTNSDAWLKDETGGRRFWPVRCRWINIEALSRDRDQLWAEAAHKFKAGAKWWLDEAELVKEATEEQRGRYVEDPWHARVLRYADAEASLLDQCGKPRGTASVPEILMHLGVDVAKQDQAAANRVARCLRVAGWERFNSGPRDDREWRYRPRPKAK